MCVVSVCGECVGECVWRGEVRGGGGGVGVGLKGMTLEKRYTT